MARFRLFDLNPEQHAAVTTTEGPVLILAGAGTGKTRVITARIAYMVHNGIPAHSILAVTFTNKAANEMRERAAGMVDKADAKALTIGTFHSLCVRVLRTSIDRLGYKKNFTIYSDGEQTGLLKKIINRTAARDEKLEPAVIKSIISRAKNDGRGAPPPTDESLPAEVFRRYETELRRLNAVDFDDLLQLAVQVLMEHPDVRDEWAAKFRYLMVDEFQDTNRLQLEMVRALAGKESNVCVVGDDDQSIYSWRGAEVTNILEFERHFPDPKVIKLEQNYRSTNAILRTANSLIKNNPRRRPKNLWSEHGDGAPVRVISVPDDKEEAVFVSDEILKMQQQENLPFEAFAVLYRMNAQSRLIEENLRERKIPYRLIGGKSFFERREVKDVTAYGNVLIHQEDDISLLRIINNPPRGIGPTIVERALTHSSERKQSLRAALMDPEFQETLSTKACEAIRKFNSQLQIWAAALHQPLVNPGDVLERVITEAGFLSELKRTCKTPEEGLSRETNVREFLSACRDFSSRQGGDLEAFLDSMALDEEQKEDKKNEDGSGVTLITMHAAKGLEFPNVFLIGAEEGLIPHARSKIEGNVDEERRLFYVGITRAMRQLTLTYCAARMRWGDRVCGEASSFIGELDPAHLERVDLEEILSRPATEEDARSAFARMRALLAG